MAASNPVRGSPAPQRKKLKCRTPPSKYSQHVERHSYIDFFLEFTPINIYIQSKRNTNHNFVAQIMYSLSIFACSLQLSSIRSGPTQEKFDLNQ